MPNFGYIRVGAAVPKVKVGDVDFNTEQIIRTAKEAEQKGVEVLVFPELSITSYTAGDLFHQQLLINKALDGLGKIVKETQKLNIIILVGLPLACDNKIFNVAAIIKKGKILGFVPKTYIPNYKEFYEARWFSPAKDLISKEIEILGQKVPVGKDLIFELENWPEVKIGIEICEDLWIPIPPSSYQALFGANLIFNLSASNEIVGKANYRRGLVASQSAKTFSGYIYTSCGSGESSMDVVFSGHAIISENGAILNELRFSRENSLIISDMDMEHIISERNKITSFSKVADREGSSFRIVKTPYIKKTMAQLQREIAAHPFLPTSLASRDETSKEIFLIQSTGLAKRIENSGIDKLVIGISGGLDSTLALLVSIKTLALLNKSPKNIYAFSMPGFGTSNRTKSNALKLCEALGVNFEEIDITRTVTSHFSDINQNIEKQDVTYENSQARYRTMILMDKANQLKGLVVGTGDLSEIALGWCTFNGDHISNYNVNAGVPKTLIKYLIDWVAKNEVKNPVTKILKDIINTPISPELLKIRNSKKDTEHKTEDLIGPYELHDFFLYHFLRWGSRPSKILFMAKQVKFDFKYTDQEILKWLKLFLQRFFRNQWKRSVMSDGPKVGSVALSPRGDWRMPSDSEMVDWINDLKNY